MNKLLIGCAALVAAVAAPGAIEVVSEVEIGVTAVAETVSSAENVTASLVPVPYLALDATTAKLSTLIDTRTLAAGDKVRVWNGTAYTVFVRNDTNDGWASENAEGQTTQTDIDVPVGTGLVFQTTDKAKAVAAIGRVPSVPTTSVAANRPTLLANPLATGFNLAAVTPATANDMIVVNGTDKILRWDAAYNDGKGAWYSLETETKTIAGQSVPVAKKNYDADNLTVPASQSFWYLGKGASGVSLTITWQ